MDAPYTPPVEATVDAGSIARSKRFWGRTAWICAVAAVIPPLFGLVGTVRGFTAALAEMNRNGSADPTALAGEIASSLIVTMCGLGVSILILIPFSVSLVLFLKNRRLLRAFSQQNMADGGTSTQP
jgi:biopolymer transport protein ExbB/TolQ